MKTRAAKQAAADKYRETHKEVKRSARRDKDSSWKLRKL
jgi:hypothetical protein